MGLHPLVQADTQIGSSYVLNSSGAVCTTPGTPSGASPTWTCQVPTASGYAVIQGVANDPSRGAPDLDSLASHVAASLGDGALLLGNMATRATGPQSLAIGNAAQASGAQGVAVGAEADASGARSLALGAGAVATQPGSVALGSDSVTGRAVPVPNAVMGGNTFIFAGSNPVGVVSVGAPGAERQIQNVAAGRIGPTSTDAVNGSQLYATQQTINGLVQIGKEPVDSAAGTAPQQQAVRYDSLGDGSVDRDNVTLGNGTSKGQVALHNVAPGVAPTDAVNVRQLGAATAALDGRINTLAAQVNRDTRMLSGGIAASAAMAVVTPVEPGRYHVGGAFAGYNGEAGVGFNLLKRSNDGQKTLHAGVGWGSGGGKAIVRVGFGFSFD